MARTMAFKEAVGWLRLACRVNRACAREALVVTFWNFFSNIDGPSGEVCPFSGTFPGI